MLPANSSASSSSARHLENFGLEKLAPSLFKNMRLCGHKIVGVESVCETVLTVKTQCASQKCCFDPKNTGNACLTIKKEGLELVYAKFEHKYSTDKAKSMELGPEKYNETDVTELKSALKEAQQRAESAIAERRKDEEFGGDIVDTPFEMISAINRRKEMENLNKVIKF